jgi:pentatricopeptide repeat protein
MRACMHTCMLHVVTMPQTKPRMLAHPILSPSPPGPRPHRGHPQCGKMSSALDIFDSMRAEGCTPNVVTYNTLIDVHGKLGQWDRAIGVIKLMRSEVGGAGMDCMR